MAQALRRIWCTDGTGKQLRSWLVGTSAVADASGIQGKIGRMLASFEAAGPWAAWMGVFDRSWMELLKAGGMSHGRARKLTTRLATAITRTAERS